MQVHPSSGFNIHCIGISPNSIYQKDPQGLNLKTCRRKHILMIPRVKKSRKLKILNFTILMQKYRNHSLFFVFKLILQIIGGIQTRYLNIPITAPTFPILLNIYFFYHPPQVFTKFFPNFACISQNLTDFFQNQAKGINQSVRGKEFNILLKIFFPSNFLIFVEICFRYFLKK